VDKKNDVKKTSRAKAKGKKRPTGCRLCFCFVLMGFWCASRQGGFKSSKILFATKQKTGAMTPNNAPEPRPKTRPER
jgi:hypothetical protein